MNTHAVIKTGGKQYIVKKDDEVVVDLIGNLGDKDQKIELDTIATFNADGSQIELGKPVLAKKTQAIVLESAKGDKVRVAKFKAKVRYRKVNGFRPQLTKLKIVSI